MDRLRYFVVRTIQSVVLLFLILTFLFFFFRLLPGNYTDIMTQATSDPQAIEAFRQRWGLDEPLHVQYWNYISNFAQLNFGESMVHRVSVWEYTKWKIFNSFILVAPAITTGYVVGSVFGGVIGTSRGSLLEKHGIVVFIILGAFPLFFTSIFLVVIFSGWLGWFPPNGLVSVTSNQASGLARYATSDFLYHYILPFTAIVLRYVYFPALITRTNIIEILGQDFIFYHRISGLPKRVRFQNILKHASLPVITLYPIQMTRAIGGLVLVETVFNWPGIGFALINAIRLRDFPTAQFVFFLVAVSVVVGNFVVDIVLGIIDPRISIEE